MVTRLVARIECCRVCVHCGRGMDRTASGERLSRLLEQPHFELECADRGLLAAAAAAFCSTLMPVERQHGQIASTV